MPPPPTSIRIESESGDPVGEGGTLWYSQQNSLITVETRDGVLGVSIVGDERWTGTFAQPPGSPFLVPGDYPDVDQWPFHPRNAPAMAWSGGSGRACGSKGDRSFAFDTVIYRGDALARIGVTFEQACSPGGPSLRGTIQWTADDPTLPPDPVHPPPSGLWSPSPDHVPDSGNYVHLEYHTVIGGPTDDAYSYGSGDFALTEADNVVVVTIPGDGANWLGQFKNMYHLPEFRLGYYDGVRRFPFHNPAKGGLSWSGKGSGCNQLDGWYVIDRVTYANGVLSSLAVRFQQRCEGTGLILFGAVDWTR